MRNYALTVTNTLLIELVVSFMAITKSRNRPASERVSSTTTASPRH